MNSLAGSVQIDTSARFTSGEVEQGATQYTELVLEVAGEGTVLQSAPDPVEGVVPLHVGIPATSAIDFSELENAVLAAVVPESSAGYPLDVELMPASLTEAQGMALTEFSIRGGVPFSSAEHGKNKHSCTTGFAAQKYTGGIAVNGFVSADHCNDDDNPWTHWKWYAAGQSGARDILSWNTGQENTSGADITFIAAEQSEGISNAYYYKVGKTKKARKVVSPKRGDEVCWFGRTSKSTWLGRVRCKNVRDASVYATVGNERMTYLKSFTVGGWRANKGDSGGPVWMKNNPGNVVGVISSGGKCPTNKTDTAMGRNLCTFFAPIRGGFNSHDGQVVIYVK